MIQGYFRTLKDKKLKKVDDLRKGGWLNVSLAEKSDIERISKLTDLPHADLRDGLDEYEVPRIERRDGNVIVFVRNPAREKEGLHTETLMIVLTKENLITVAPRKNMVIEKLLQEKDNLITTQKTKLLLSILLAVAREFTIQLKSMRSEVVQRQGDWDDIDAREISKMTLREEVLNQYLSVLIPMKNVFEVILSGTHMGLHAADSELFDDVLISIKQSVDVCDVSLKSIRSIRDAHQTIFTNRLNRAVKLLTSLTVILTIPTILASLYGMNVSLPLESHPIAFWWVIFLSFALSAIILWIFWRKKWL